MQIKFYCENCGAQVPLNVERCPACRKIFFSVMCPLCKYEALPKEFRFGCPSCGYMSRRMKVKIKEKELSEKEKKKRRLSSFKKKRKRIQLPLWSYKLAVVALIASIIGLIILIIFTAK
jgi:predicted RNA-binding Zn-ribbon protein involved in translation (DUF1610 family)